MKPKLTTRNAITLTWSILFALCILGMLTSCNMLLQKPEPVPANSALHQSHMDFTSKLSLP